MHGPHRQHQTGKTAGGREHEALGEQLRDDPSPARAERGADGDFTGPRGGAREQQVGDVDARDQQHEHHGAEEHEQGPTYVSDEHVEQRLDANGVPADFLGILLCQSPLDSIEIGFGLLRRDAGFQAADNTNVVGAPLIVAEVLGTEHERHPELDAVRKVEPLGHDADDGVGLSFQVDRAARRGRDSRRTAAATRRG